MTQKTREGVLDTPTVIQAIASGNLLPTDSELAQVHHETSIERIWSADEPRFASGEDLHVALASGALRSVTLQTSNYRLITRYHNPSENSPYVPALALPALTALETLTATWRDEADRLGVDAGIRLSVTSLARSERHQSVLVRAGKLAVPGSSHTAGLAFDIDHSGYYVSSADTVAAVSLRPLETRKSIGDGLKALTHEPVHIEQRHERPDPRVGRALDVAAGRLATSGMINVVHEFPDTIQACIHFGVHPSFGLDIAS